MPVPRLQSTYIRDVCQVGRLICCLSVALYNRWTDLRVLPQPSPSVVWRSGWTVGDPSCPTGGEMSRIMVVLLGIAALTARPIDASAQTDTTRRRDTTRTPTQDTTRRVQLEARGETDLGRSSVRFGVGRANYGFSSGQALELQQALTRAGCDVGKADGVIGQRTLRGIQCFRDQQNLGSADFEFLLTARH